MSHNTESLEFIKDFAKKTGDLGSLSEVDLELLALTHTLYVREGLGETLRKVPPSLKEYEETAA